MTVAQKLACLAILGVPIGAPFAAYAAGDPSELRRLEVCTEQYAPFCGDKDDVRKVYSNTCFAAGNGNDPFGFAAHDVDERGRARSTSGMAISQGNMTGNVTGNVTRLSVRMVPLNRALSAAPVRERLDPGGEVKPRQRRVMPYFEILSL